LAHFLPLRHSCLTGQRFLSPAVECSLGGSEIFPLKQLTPFTRIPPMTKTVEATETEAIRQVIAEGQTKARATDAAIDEIPIALQFVKDLGGMDNARRALDDLERILRN
jgi:hypothetical protein